MRTIYALATDSAGCFYQRLQMPLDELVRRWPDEWRWQVGGLPNDEYPPGSVIIAQRFAGDQPAWVDLCKRRDVLCVYDLDDDLVDVDPANQVPYGIYQPQREGTIANIAAAHVVTVSTVELARKVREWNPTVVVLPNCVADDLRRYPGDHRGGFVIGWAGSMFHAQDFTGSFLDAIHRFARDYPGVRWLSIGADYMSQALPRHVVHDRVGWGSIAGYHRALSRLDVGLAPLRITPFNWSKSWIKCLDYMACGVIPVATMHGQYPELITSGSDGVLSADGADFYVHLERLVTAPGAVLDDMRGAATDTASQYTISRCVSGWADIYRKVATL